MVSFGCNMANGGDFEPTMASSALESPNRDSNPQIVQPSTTHHYSLVRLCNQPCSNLDSTKKQP